MPSVIGQRILRHRKRLKLTQDELGSRYSISGPAVFKFEKGYVVPSLELWLRMAKDMNITERSAVLMHTQEKLPEPYRSMVGFDGILAEESVNASDGEDFRRMKDDRSLRKAIVSNNWLPAGLIEFARREDLWVLYAPTGEEVNVLRDSFGLLGEGTARDFCDALRLLREFRGVKD